MMKNWSCERRHWKLWALHEVTQKYLNITNVQVFFKYVSNWRTLRVKNDCVSFFVTFLLATGLHILNFIFPPKYSQFQNQWNRFAWFASKLGLYFSHQHPFSLSCLISGLTSSKLNIQARLLIRHKFSEISTLVNEWLTLESRKMWILNVACVEHRQSFDDNMDQSLNFWRQHGLVLQFFDNNMD